MRSFSFLFLVCLLLVGCGRPALPAPVPPSVPGNNTGTGTDSPVVADRPVYTLYSPRLVGKGGSALLFFAQTGDPFSEQNDLLLRRLYASGAARLSTYRLDYGSSTGARFTYGVIVPDTFVLLGPGGERKTSIIHPQETELRGILISP